MKPLLTLPLVLAFASCGSRPASIVQTGPNSYLATRTSAAGAFADTSSLKLRTIQDANSFAAQRGKTAQMISADERRPIIGGLPSYEYQFKLTQP